MGVELRLVIGEKWNFETDEYLEGMRDFHKQYGRSIRQVAEVDLSGVDRSVWAMVEAAQKEAQAHFDATGEFFTIHTGISVEGDDGQWHEKNHTRDSYGNLIAAIPLTKAYEVLLRAQADAMGPEGNWKGRGYRRYAIALALIQSVIQEFGREDTVALTFGH